MSWRPFQILLTTTCLILVGAGVGWRWMHFRSPDVRLIEARKVAQTDKSRALEIVRSILRQRRGDSVNAAMFECKLLLELKRGIEAEKSFRAIDHPDKIDSGLLCQLAEMAHGLGVEALARRAYSAAGEYVLNDRLHFKRLIYATYAAREQGFEKSVVELCDDYSLRNTTDSYGWIISARLFSEQRQMSDAVRALKEGLKRDVPLDEITLHRMGLVRMALSIGDISTAREQCDELAKTALNDQLNLRYRMLQAEVLLRENKPDQAFETLSSLPQAQADIAEIHAMKGKSKYQLGEFKPAIAELTVAVQANDFDTDSHYLLGQIYLKLKDEASAMKHLKRATALNELKARVITLENQLRDDQSNRSLKLQLAALNEQRGDFRRAAEWRRAAGESPP